MGDLLYKLGPIKSPSIIIHGISSFSAHHNVSGEVMVDQWQHNKRLATIYSSRSVKHRVFSVCRCVVIKTNLGTIRNKF